MVRICERWTAFLDFFWSVRVSQTCPPPVNFLLFPVFTCVCCFNTPSLSSLGLSPFSSRNCQTLFPFFKKYQLFCFLNSLLFCSKLKVFFWVLHFSLFGMRVFIERPEDSSCVWVILGWVIFPTDCIQGFLYQLTLEQGAFWSTWPCRPDALGMSCVTCALGTCGRETYAPGWFKLLAPSLLLSFCCGFFSSQVASGCCFSELYGPCVVLGDGGGTCPLMAHSQGGHRGPLPRLLAGHGLEAGPERTRSQKSDHRCGFFRLTGTRLPPCVCPCGSLGT